VHVHRKWHATKCPAAPRFSTGGSIRQRASA
jgi:hypothetical protein